MLELKIDPDGNHYRCSGCEDICLELTHDHLICMPQTDFDEMKDDPTCVWAHIESAALGTANAPPADPMKQSTNSSTKQLVNGRLKMAKKKRRKQQRIRTERISINIDTSLFTQKLEAGQSKNINFQNLFYALLSDNWLQLKALMEGGAIPFGFKNMPQGAMIAARVKLTGKSLRTFALGNMVRTDSEEGKAYLDDVRKAHPIIKPEITDELSDFFLKREEEDRSKEEFAIPIMVAQSELTAPVFMPDINNQAMNPSQNQPIWNTFMPIPFTVLQSTVDDLTVSMINMLTEMHPSIKIEMTGDGRWFPPDTPLSRRLSIEGV